MINLINAKKFISTRNITFLMDIDKAINVNKNGKYYYHKFFYNDLDSIKDFILRLDTDNIYLIMPFISVNCKLNDPFITLSKQFLISNESNYLIIINYLNNQLSIALQDFGIEIENLDLYLIFKYKRITLEDRKF